MKRFNVLFLMLSLGLLVSAQSGKSEAEVIKTVIQTAYVEGLQNEGDVKKIDAGFHPDFNLLSIGEDDNLRKLPIADWKTSTLEKKKKGELPRKGDDLVSVKFKSVDITGTAASVKLEFYVGKTLKYVDYLSLYKFESGWKIVNKIYTRID